MQLRPSSSNMWVKCSAMPRFSKGIADVPTDPAREGTCAAWVAEMMFTNQVQSIDELLGKSHENGWVVEAEMLEHIQGYYDHVMSRGGDIVAERQVTFNEYVQGTPDCYAFVEGGTLYVDDLKYGYQIVEPYKNTQISIYAGAILNDNPEVKKVVLGIYQPRAFHPSGIYRTWEPDLEEFKKWISFIDMQSRRAQMHDSEANPGDHCGYCNAASTCFALASSLYKAYNVVSDNRSGVMNPQEISNELTFLETLSKMVEARHSSVKAEASARISNSEFIPNWGLVPKQGRRAFKVEGLGILALTGVNPYSNKIVTPAELERRGADPDVVKQISYNPQLPAKLVRKDNNYFNNAFKNKDIENESS